MEDHDNPYQVDRMVVGVLGLLRILVRASPLVRDHIFRCTSALSRRFWMQPKHKTAEKTAEEEEEGGGR